jgi:hypothetical protein
MRAVRHGIPVFADTRVKVPHKPTFTKAWHDEAYYLRNKEKVAEFWDDTQAVPA